METTSTLTEEQPTEQFAQKAHVAVAKRSTTYVLLTVIVVIVLTSVVALVMCYQALEAEAYSRFIGIMNVSSEKVAKTIRGAELSAKNIFDEVGHHLDSPEDVITALESKANLNLDVRGYFAAFEPEFFPEKGTWFEPYVFQGDGLAFEMRQVGSARHNYMKSPWYVRAKMKGETFWSDPYYYYDGTTMSGHYCTFVKPIYGQNGKLVCVCGADMKFEWLAKELQWVDEMSQKSQLMNKHHLIRDFGFYTIILDKNGTCLAYPEGKDITVTDKEVLNDLARQKSGIANIDINGEPCTLYYGPIEFIDWSVAVVVPRLDMLKPLLPAVAVLLVVAVIGIVVVWRVLRRATTALES